jgi:hypothetical protein
MTREDVMIWTYYPQSDDVFAIVIVFVLMRNLSQYLTVILIFLRIPRLVAGVTPKTEHPTPSVKPNMEHPTPSATPTPVLGFRLGVRIKNSHLDIPRQGLDPGVGHYT